MAREYMICVDNAGCYAQLQAIQAWRDNSGFGRVQLVKQYFLCVEGALSDSMHAMCLSPQLQISPWSTCRVLQMRVEILIHTAAILCHGDLGCMLSSIVGVRGEWHSFHGSYVFEHASCGFEERLPCVQVSRSQRG
jgi:hypothetical protein